MVQIRNVREHLRYERISFNLFKRIMSLLARQVENNLSEILPDKIALTIDGQSTLPAHYGATFASFPTNDGQRFFTEFLAVSPLKDETTQDVDEHISFMEFVLGVFGKYLDGFRALIGDNCSTNRAIANKIQRPVIGCSSYHFSWPIMKLYPMDVHVQHAGEAYLVTRCSH